MAPTVGIFTSKRQRIARSGIRDGSAPHRTSPVRRNISTVDRFIPNRYAMDMDISKFALNDCPGKEDQVESSPHNSVEGSSCAPDSDIFQTKRDATYRSEISYALLNSGLGNSWGPKARSRDLSDLRVLSFTDKDLEARTSCLNSTYLQRRSALAPHDKFRKISQSPVRILDAPGLKEDYYLNVLDWNSSNILAVALYESVHLWNAESGSVQELCNDRYGYGATSVSWMPSRNILAIGTENHEVQLWDVERFVCLRRMRSHSGRVGSLAWNDAMLSSGSRDAQIHNHDVRIPNHHIATLSSHHQEVCGLKWSSNGRHLASGGNDNIVCIWDSQQTRYRFRFDHHSAAVKALAWCPWQNSILATGGGTEDCHIRFWNTNTGTCLNSMDTKSQVCSIIWSPNEKEFVTGHGFSQNQLTVWKYPSLMRMAELKGHGSRVLHMCLSPDGQTVLSAGADETLRFWKIFPNDSEENVRLSSQMARAVPFSSRGLRRNLSIR